METLAENPVGETFQEQALSAKYRMVLEMALEFAGMTRVFSKRSERKILPKLQEFMERVAARPEDYDESHAEFCDWFIKNVTQAAKKQTKNGRGAIPERTSSYGQAAKVLNIVAKVHFYYCQPQFETPPSLVPRLHAALDNGMIKRLARRFRKPELKSKGLNEIDRADYEQLQDLVAEEIRRDFNSEIHPVQYDDIIFRRLNREDS
jgi:hypothetical protein